MESRARQKQRFPWGIWWLAILTLALAYVFFILPRQLGDRPVRIEMRSQEPKE